MTEFQQTFNLHQLVDISALGENKCSPDVLHAANIDDKVDIHVYDSIINKITERHCRIRRLFVKQQCTP